jgi:response regulator RpfG family c-di-GMP phosphodiesterase
MGDLPPRAGLVDATAVALADLLVGLLEFRDPFVRGGSSLTRLLTTSIAHELKLADDVINAVALGAVLRDLGQLPLRNVLNRPGSNLQDEARRAMERHVEAALAALDGIKLPEITRDTIRCHHEHWDGHGYPEGLAGQAIPLGARIVAVAEAFVAMISARPHRLAKRVPVALEDIRKNSGTHFDPAVVDAMDRVINNTTWKGPGFALRRHVLIVDPDESRAMVTATRLCAYGYLAEVAFTIAAAEERLESSRVSGIVISARLSAHDDFVLLRRVRETARLATIPVVISDAPADERVQLLESGADVCLSRNASFEELKATLDAFLRREDKATASPSSTVETNFTRLRGDIRDFPLNWLLQVLNYDSRTAGVFLVTNGDEGAIYLEGGNPRHAQTRHLSGEEALRAMLMWKNGAFSVEPDARSEARTISATLMNILLHSAAEEDHATFFGQIRT